MHFDMSYDPKPGVTRLLDSYHLRLAPPPSIDLETPQLSLQNSTKHYHNGTALPLHILLLLLRRFHILQQPRQKSHIQFATTTRRRRGGDRRDIRPPLPTCELFSLPARTPPLLHRVPPDTMSALYHRGSCMLVLSLMLVRSAVIDCTIRREQVYAELL
jgi:hypothetical protein